MRKLLSICTLQIFLALGTSTAIATSGYRNEQVLDAPSGELTGLEFENTSQGKLRIAAQFVELREGSAWSPCVFVGLRSSSREDQFRLFYMQHKKGDKDLIMGYEYSENGKNLKRTAIVTRIPKTEEIELEMEWAPSGEVHFKDALGRKQKFDTRLKSAIPFIQVCSAKAKVRWSIY